MQITAMAGQRPENQNALLQLLESYRNLLFPGAGKSPNEALERAKKLLAEEVKKVYVVRKIEGPKDLRNAFQKAEQIGHPDLARLAIGEIRKSQEREASRKR